MSAVTTPDDDFIVELRSAVMRLRRRLVTERHPDNLLSIPQMAVLGALQRHGEMTVGQLASFEKVQPPTMTRTVNALEAEGLVARRPHETDGRQSWVGLTLQGRHTVAADRSQRDAWLREHLATLTPEEHDTLRAAAPLLRRLADED